MNARTPSDSVSSSRSRRISRRGSRRIRTRRARSSAVHQAPPEAPAPDPAPDPPPSGASRVRPRWSYYTHTIDVSGTLATGHLDPERVNGVLDELGAEGWELVSSYGSGNARGTHTLVFIFKRPA